MGVAASEQSDGAGWPGEAPLRVVLDDQRGGARHLRVSWHPERGVFVISHWRDGVCTASVRLDRSAADALLPLFQRGLADAAPRPATGDGGDAAERAGSDLQQRQRR